MAKKYDKKNIFAQIIKGDIPCTKVYEDKEILAFNDINPAAKVHVLVVPKGEYVSFQDFVEKAGDKKVAGFFNTVGKIARKLKVTEKGYRVITNHGKHAQQTVPHFHIHLVAGRPLGGLLPGDKAKR